MTATTFDADGRAAPPRPRAGYTWYVLALLFLANCFNAMDRSIVTILVEPIKHDLKLDDTQIGIITGLGYALVYAVVGLAIAPIVNGGNRKTLLAGGIALWSGMTALTGLSTGFISMLGARLGIAAGEATCYPSALSLIGDYFDRARRSRAIAIFQLGTYGGIIGGIMLASVVGAHYGWRAAFSILGLPGLAFAVLIFLTMREPARGVMDSGTAAGPAVLAAPSGSALSMMLRLLATNRLFAILTTCSVIMAMAQVTMGVWVPAFLMRVHHVTQQQVGLSAVPFIGLSGIVGTVVGGFLGTRIAQRRHEERAPLLVMLWSAPLAVPSLLLFLFAPSFPLSVVGGVIAVFFIAMHFGPLVAVIIGTVDERSRGSATSLLTTSQFLIGLGLGPLIVGKISDLVEPSLHLTSLRYAMLLAPVTVALSWVLCLIGYRAFEAAGTAPHLSTASRDGTSSAGRNS